MAGRKYEDFVQKGRPIWKIITGILFSHLGLFVLCLSYGALGKFAVILLLFVPFLGHVTYKFVFETDKI
jgi:hypothetical protein